MKRYFIGAVILVRAYIKRFAPSKGGNCIENLPAHIISEGAQTSGVFFKERIYLTIT
jgi:hypothetical protein